MIATSSSNKLLSQSISLFHKPEIKPQTHKPEIEPKNINHKISLKLVPTSHNLRRESLETID